MNPRTRSRTYAGICALALTAIAVLLLVLTTRITRRTDITATRAHQLSPRTAQILDALRRNATLAIAADLSKLDPASRQSLIDVLEKLQRPASKGATFSTRLMNTGTKAGLAEFDALMLDLAKGESTAIEARTAELTKMTADADDLARSVQGLVGLLQGARDEVLASFNKQAQGQWDTLAATLSATEQDLATAAAAAREQLAMQNGPLPIPPIDQAKATLAPPAGVLASALTQASTLCEQVYKAQQTTGALREKIAPILAQLSPLRDRAGRLATGLSTLQVPRVLMVARAVERSRAVLLIADPRTPGAPLDVVAIEPAAILQAGNQTGEFRARAEDVIAGAIANLNTSARPRVVFVHDYPSKLALLDWKPFTLAVKRLSARGIDAAEWAVAVDRDLAPDLASHDPLRPAVFVPLPGLARAAGDARAQVAALPMYINALKALMESGRPILWSIEPSNIPSIGSDDPIIAPLLPLGIKADTARIILEESKLGTRRVVSPYFDLVPPPDPANTSPIPGTLTGLRFRASFPVPIAIENPAAGVQAWPIVVIPASEARWAENEWSEYGRAVAQLKGEYAGIDNAPAFDAKADARAGAEGFVIAAAVERPVPPPGAGTQRVVVVGLNGWFLDALTAQQAEIDGRTAVLFPGNMQLLESSVHWLAGQDDQLVRTASSSSSPTIPPMNDAQLTALRWGLAAGLPAGALVLGLLWRLWRG